MWYMIRMWWIRMTAIESPTKLPGRWMNVGKGRVDIPVADPAYTPSKKDVGRIRDDVHRLFSNCTL